MKINISQRCLLALTAVFAVSTSAADVTIDSFLALDLEDLANYPIVAPTKTETSLSKAPGTVTVITFDQIQNSSAKTIPELLRSVPGINVRWNPMVQTIDARGFGSNPFTSRILLLIDGVPYNSWNKGGFPQHPGFDFFNLENVKHIEIIRGPGSALYGENALHGVINIVTLSGREFPQTTIKAFGGSRDTHRLSVTHGSELGDDTAIFASVSAEKTRLPGKFWENSDAEGQDLFVKLEHRDWLFSWYRRQDEFEGFVRPFDSPRLPPDSAFLSADKIEQTIDIFAAEFDHMAASEQWSVKLNASHASRDGSHCATCHSPQGTSTEPADYAGSADHGYQQYLEAQLGVHSVKNHDFLIGTEYRRISSGNNRQDLHDFTESVTAYDKLAFFAQDNISLFDDAVNVVVGARYDLQTSPRLFDSGVFPRIAVVSRPSDKLTFRASWSKAARYPSFTELYLKTPFIVADSPSARIGLSNFTPNPDLKPEEISSTELGLSYQFSEWAEGRIDLYRNEIERSIAIAYPTFRFENHPNDAIVSGFETEFRLHPSRTLSAYLNWSYQHNEQRGDGTDSSGNRIDFSYAPRHKVNLGTSFFPSDALSGNVEVSWRDKYTAPAFWYRIALGDPTVRPLDGYALVNLSLRYRMPFVLEGGKRPLTLSVYGKNLGDERPYETLIGVDVRLTGREWFIGFEYDWIR